MLRLRCQTQNYAWGRLPSESSEVADLTAAAGTPVDDSKPYAELWMGTHPSGMSVLASAPNTSLKAWLEAHPEALGEQVLQRFGPDLPFLFKVLSVGTALSIQSHPDKELGIRLHAERPEVYKDPNHKPEMTIAIAEAEALCSFVPHAELATALQDYPELASCIVPEAVQAVLRSNSSSNDSQPGSYGAGPGETDAASAQRSSLKAAFTALMTCDATKVAAAIRSLVPRLEGQLRESGKLRPKDELVLRLNRQYPDDVGVLSAYFLNLVQLKPHQAIFLPANEPHAYLSGEMVECMATSDNVIRAGLTPKLRDTGVLCESLTYTQGPPTVLDGKEVQEYTRVYSPPFDEFEVFSVSLPAAKSTILPASPGPLLVLVTRGQGSATVTAQLADPALDPSPTLKKGDVLFVPARSSIYLNAGSDPLQLWIAAVNGRVFADSFKLPNGAQAAGRLVEKQFALN